MSAYNPSFIRKGFSPGLSSFLQVHENPAEGIQGGLPLNHYHVTSTELAWVDTIPVMTTNLTNIMVRREPVMIAGNLVSVSKGDLLMARE